jgi:hypothetical protein
MKAFYSKKKKERDFPYIIFHFSLSRWERAGERA